MKLVYTVEKWYEVDASKIELAKGFTADEFYQLQFIDPEKYESIVAEGANLAQELMDDTDHYKLLTFAYPTEN